MKWFIRIFISFGLVFFGGLSLLALYSEYGFPWKYGQKQHIMETYLEDKYKDIFTFEQIRFDLLHGRNYYAYATAASTGVTFYVEVSPENEVKDEYSYEYWNSAVKELFEPLFQPTLKQFERMYSEVFFTKHMDLQTFDPSKASFMLFVHMGGDLTEENVAEQVTRWLTALEAIRAAKLSVEQITIHYYSKDIYLTRTDIQEIQSAEQLRDIFN